MPEYKYVMYKGFIDALTDDQYEDYMRRVAVLLDITDEVFIQAGLRAYEEMRGG